MLLKKHGRVVVVMVFDDEDQAVTTAEKVRICKRNYDILVNEVQKKNLIFILIPFLFKPYCRNNEVE